MNLYQQQHQFYCGIDLHANKMYACVVDSNGKKQLHRNFHTRDTRTFLEKLQPFSKDLVIGCESTFNWYWLCDLCEGKQIPFVLGHALYLKAIHGGKKKNDKIDSEKLAYLLRGGNFAVAYAYHNLGELLEICSEEEPITFENEAKHLPISPTCTINTTYRSGSHCNMHPIAKVCPNDSPIRPLHSVLKMTSRC